MGILRVEVEALRYIYLDAHTHLMNYACARRAALSMQKEGVAAWAMALDPIDYAQATADAAGCSLVNISCGVHPWRSKDWVERLQQLDQSLAQCWMIGEIGLDDRWADPLYRETQRPVFEYQLRAAKALQKPVNIHSAGAEREVLDCLRAARLEAPVIIHWYDGDAATLRELRAMDCYFTVGPNVGEDALAAALCREIPLDRLLCETDGPVSLAWVRHRGIQAADYDVKNIAKVYRAAAAVRALPEPMLRQRVNDNAKRIMAGR